MVSAAIEFVVPAPRPMSSPGEMLVQMRPFPFRADLSFETAWRDLERRSIHADPFLSPAFLLAQKSDLHAAGESQLLTIMDDQGRWLAAGLFHTVSASKQLPLPHLVATQTEHAFLSGLLVDEVQAEPVLGALWEFLRHQGLHGIAFPRFPIESRLGGLLRRTCEQQQTVTTTDDLICRATVDRNQAATDEGISAKRTKSLKKGLKWLEKQGAVSVHIVTASRADEGPIERFLTLEAMGWKGEELTALASRDASRQAFRTLALEMSDQGRLRFAELRIGEKVIASLCLMQSQTEYFAFKIGWDPRFERGCPGFLLAREVRRSFDELPGCSQIDSCACPGSFLEHVWPGRKSIGTALFTTTLLGSAAASGTHWARGVWRRWRGRPSDKLSVALQNTPVECVDAV